MPFKDKKIGIIGAGNMGLTLVKMALGKNAHIILFDKNPEALIPISNKFREYIDSGRLTLDVIQDSTSNIIFSEEIHAIIIALSWSDGRDIINTISSFDVCPVILLGRPDLEDSLILSASRNKYPIFLGTGLEPGLIESISSNILEKNSQSLSIESYCGGLPETPVGPFGYKVTFGKKLPIDPRVALKIKKHKRLFAQRFYEVKHKYFSSIGILEAFDDAMLATTAEHFENNVVNFAQKTLRWPGFCDAARACEALGLLSPRKIDIGNLNISIRDLTNYLINSDYNSPATENDDFVLCKWEHVNHSGEKGELVIKVTQPERDMSAMAFVTCAFALTATQSIFDTEISGIIYPHEEPAVKIGVKFLQELKSSKYVEIKASGTLTSIIEEEAV